jgi:protein TonB
VLLEGAAPPYPAAALRLGWRGTVHLILAIDASGRVQSANVKRSSGHALLDEAALTAVRTWRYSPALRAGQPSAVTVNKAITFRF